MSVTGARKTHCDIVDCEYSENPQLTGTPVNPQ